MVDRQPPTACGRMADTINAAHTDASSPVRQQRPHLQSSSLPSPTKHQQPQQQRGLARRDTERVGLRVLGEHVNSYTSPISLHPNGDSRTPRSPVQPMPSPPYPVTPPLQQPEPALPTLGFRAPTPLPSPAVLAAPSLPDPKPPRILQLQRHCVSRLDASLRDLSLVALASGFSLLISAILFFRSVVAGTPHAPAGRTAILIYFCFSVVAFVFTFSLVLGILCRRARHKSTTPDLRVRVRDEVELQEFAAMVAQRFAAEVREENRWPRRNAISGTPRRTEADAVFGAWPAETRHVEQNEGWVIRRPNALPLRVQSAPLLGWCGGALPARHLSCQHETSPQQSATIPTGPDILHTLPDTTKPSFHNDWTVSGALSTTAQPSPNSPDSMKDHAISPKTKTKSWSTSAGCASVLGLPSSMLGQHMRMTGTRELQAYLQAPSVLSLNTLAADPPSDSSGASRRGNSSVIPDNHPEGRSPHRVRTASVLSIRPGRARECYIRASPGAATVLGDNRTETSRINDPTIDSKTQTTKRRPSSFQGPKKQRTSTRRPFSVQEPLGSAPLLPFAQRNRENQMVSRRGSALEGQRSRSLSPQKLVRSGGRMNLVGLGIEMDKENVAPEQVDGRHSEEIEGLDSWVPVVPFESA